MKLTIVLLLSLLISSVVFSQSPKQPTTWKIVGQINDNRIEFKCIDGCLWKLNAVTCTEIAECRWTLDQAGLLAQADPINFEAELEKGRQEYQRRREE